jgi:hypothetical protein
MDLAPELKADLADVFLRASRRMGTASIKTGLRGLAIEYYNWLTIAAAAPDDVTYHPPGILRSIWVYHLMQDTKKYAEFCNKHFGKMIHFQDSDLDKQTKRAKKDATVLVRRTMPKFNKLAAGIWGATPQSPAYNNEPQGLVFVASITTEGPNSSLPFHADYTFGDLAIKQNQKVNYIAKGRLMDPKATLGNAGIAPGDTLLTVEQCE